MLQHYPGNHRPGYFSSFIAKCVLFFCISKHNSIVNTLFVIAKDAANESLIPSHGAVSDLNRREEYLVPAAQFSAHSQRAFSRLFTPFPCLFTPFPCLRPARDGPRLRQAVPTHSMTSPADSSITEAGFPPHENDRPIACKFHRLRCIIFPICPEIE